MDNSPCSGDMAVCCCLEDGPHTLNPGVMRYRYVIGIYTLDSLSLAEGAVIPIVGDIDNIEAMCVAWSEDGSTLSILEQMWPGLNEDDFDEGQHPQRASPMQAHTFLRTTVLVKADLQLFAKELSPHGLKALLKARVD